ncbi:flagellar basal body rod protein FlgB [Pararhizobium sp.]|uniref:flagellar basal body rod protein FlgB n=1 Tax=Pararhizobium sp. TaxID=1977563 RepID=UPI00272053EF|nr:flagellar basal body rod protein FlgB [Pararhizobium sp.]MDO9416066.1 flagellar basal body rod protein FlgB [Pararhizobium sp.]
MQPIQLFDLASRQAQWLAVRQNVVSGNIANVNTPGYHAKDITPFKAVLETTSTRMATTNPAHFSDNGIYASEVRDAELQDSTGVQESGNTVGLSEELMKSGEIKRDYELSTGLVKSFHRMMLMTLRK